MILNGCDITLDGEKYFGLSGNNVQCNQRFYTTNPSTTPSDIKYKKKKFAPKLLIWMAMSSKGVSNVYVHKSKQAITTDIYLNECINKRLLPFIEKHYKRSNYIFWPDKPMSSFFLTNAGMAPKRHIAALHRYYSNDIATLCIITIIALDVAL